MDTSRKQSDSNAAVAPSSDRSQARLEFANHLKELRVARGFRTARSLARALMIDENRYTRYERAEVEPDLSLIRRICQALSVTPNDLLGTGTNGAVGADVASQSPSPAGPGSHFGGDSLSG